MANGTYDLPEINLNDLNEKSLLLRIAQEMGSLRKLMTIFVNDMRNAESEVPEFMRRFMDYAHDVHNVGYMYEDLGHQRPPHLMREAERVDDRLRQLLNRLHAEGGAFAKVRREMAADPENRWDHTRLLDKPKEKPDEARNGSDVHRQENGTTFTSDLGGGSFPDRTESGKQSH